MTEYALPKKLMTHQNDVITKQFQLGGGASDRNALS